MKSGFLITGCALLLQQCVSYEPRVLVPAITLSPEQISLATNTENPSVLDFGLEVSSNESDSLFNVEVLPGIRVRSVENNGPADSAGLQAGDIILSIDDTPTNNPDAVTALQYSTGKSQFSLTVRRDTTVFQATLLARTTAPSTPPVELYRADPIASRAGYRTELVSIANSQDIPAAKVMEFFPESPLPGSGLETGDLILTIDGVQLNSAQDLITRLNQDYELGSTVRFSVYRAGTLEDIDVKLWNPGRRISRVSLGPLLNYETELAPQTTNFTLLNLWLFSLYSYNRVDGEKSHSILGLLNYSSDYGELTEE